MLTRTCLCLISRVTATGSELLLGLKKTGFGAGRWVGLGGHVEDGEKPAQAAVREVEEEAGLIVSADALAHMAVLTFLFPARPGWDQTADVYTTAVWQGEPRESEEIAPRWFRLDQLPLDAMWDDARYWLPRVLAGEQLQLRITFADDCATVASISEG